MIVSSTVGLSTNVKTGFEEIPGANGRQPRHVSPNRTFRGSQGDFTCLLTVFQLRLPGDYAGEAIQTCNAGIFDA